MISERLGRFIPILCLASLLIIAVPEHPSFRCHAQGGLTDSKSVEAAPTDELALTQSDLASRYAELEKLILRMAEFDAADNPRRAELLKKAFGLSKEKNVRLQFDKLVDLLQQQKLARAITNQKQVKTDLQTILELLLTENRADRLKDEQARIKEYIREIERIQRMHRSVQGRTEGGIDPKQAAKEQDRVAQKTAELQGKIKEQEGVPDSADGDLGESESSNKNGDKDDDSEDADSESNGSDKAATESDGSGKPSEGKPSEGKPSEGKPSEGKPSEGKPSEGKPSEGKPSEGKPSESQAGDSQSGDTSDSLQQDQQAPQDFPGQEQLRQAEEKMRQAQQRLAEAKRDAAVKDQEEAAKKLAEAKAQLEEILRQRREEEIERVLAMLESRFRKMLEMQLQVYENTMRLYKIPAARRDRFVDIESGKLSFQERRIVVEAEKCFALLRDEGSSVAFPESVQQMIEDMQSVERRLGKSQIGRITQGLEEDVIEALDEMIEALQQAQMDQDERKQQQQQQQSSPQNPEDQSLVDQIAELKMLKAMQLRINKRTIRYSRLLDDDQDVAGQATDKELVEALHELSERELRLHGITHDIVIGKNK